MMSVDSDSEEIALICLPFRANPDSPDAVMAAKTLLSLGRDVEAAIRFTEGMHPSQRDPMRRMAILAGKMVSDPALLSMLEKIADCERLRQCDDFVPLFP